MYQLQIAESKGLGKQSCILNKRIEPAGGDA